MGSSDDRSPSGRNLATDATIAGVAGVAGAGVAGVAGAGDASSSVTDETLLGTSSPSTRSGDPNNDAELPRGLAVGEYEIEEVIGRGGFGTVYRATQPVIGKRVAIKVLSRKYSADKEMVSRFTAEARAVNQIRHRHIIDIFAFGSLPDDGRHFYVMELLDGEPLDQYLATNGPLRLDQALPILRAIARALDAAHAKGVAHRDLKPENVFLARDDDGNLFPKLLDFGIAKLNNSDEALAHKTNTGVPLGTPYYMSPEQCRGQNVDHRPDVYSFGVLAYRLLTGRFPFEGALIDILHHHMHDDPPAPSTKKADLGPAVDAAILWMLHKEPSERPKSAIAAVVALQDDKTPTPMLSAILTEKVPRTATRSWLIPALALIVLAGGVIVFFTIRGSDDTPTPTPDVRPAVAPPPPAPPDAPVVTLATPDASLASTDIIIDVTGVPEGTEVSLGKTVVGSAPGPVQIPRSEKKMALTFRAEGYLSVSRPVVPDKDQPLDVGGLKKKLSPTRPTKPNPEDPDEIPSPFKKEKTR